MASNVYDELAIDFVKVARLNKFQANIIVDFLKNEGFIDYVQLKEYYEEESE